MYRFSLKDNDEFNQRSINGITLSKYFWVYSFKNSEINFHPFEDLINQEEIEGKYTEGHTEIISKNVGIVDTITSTEFTEIKPSRGRPKIKKEDIDNAE